VQRVAKRDDPLAKIVCIGEFVDGVMRTILLLNRDYTPYWKWLAHEFRKLEAAKPYVPLLEELAAISTSEQQVELVLQICGKIHQAMKNSGIVTGDGDNHPFPLLHAHSELLAKGKSD
jgi:hypothetical protein